MDSVSSFFQWENDENGNNKEGNNNRNSTSSLSFDFNSFFNQNSASIDLKEKQPSNLQIEPNQNKNTGTPFKPDSSSNTTPNTKQNFMSQQFLTDKLVEKFFSIALPPTNEMSAESLEGRVQAGKLRPGLSVQIMSRNFIQLNSRLSFPFESIDNIMKFFTWDNPKLTLTILFIYTHLILKPLQMILSIPFFLIVIHIMVPSYTTRHQPELYTILGKNNPILAEGPQLKNFELPKPAPEISREFILNLTDLQNHMLLYVMVWDFINKWLIKFAYFTDESISSFFFLCFLGIGTFLLLFVETIWSFIPLKFLLILTGWVGTIVFHPYFNDYFFQLVYSEETRYYLLKKTNKFEQILQENFGFMEPQEQREVEIFEIQKFDKESKEWKFIFYLNNDFTKLSKPRLDKKYLTNFEIIGTTLLNNVKPPKDWEFIDNDKWRIDLNPELWVSNHLLNHIVKIDNETKWVYDLQSDDSRGDFRRRRWTRSVARFSEIEYEKAKKHDTSPSSSHETEVSSDPISPA